MRHLAVLHQAYDAIVCTRVFAQWNKTIARCTFGEGQGFDSALVSSWVVTDRASQLKKMRLICFSPEMALRHFGHFLKPFLNASFIHE